MKKVLIIAALFIAGYTSKAQTPCGSGLFPTIDSLRSYINVYVRASPLNAFQNLRLNTAMVGVTQWLECIKSSGMDSISIVDASGSDPDTIKVYKNGTFSFYKLLPAGGGTGSNNANVGSGFRLLNPGTQELRTFGNTTFINWDTATSGQLKASTTFSTSDTTRWGKESVLEEGSNMTITRRAGSSAAVPDTFNFAATGGTLDGTGSASYYPTWSDANTLAGTSPLYKSSNSNLLINTTTESNNYSRLQVNSQKIIMRNDGSLQPPEFEFWRNRDSSGTIVPHLPKTRIGMFGGPEANISINMNYRDENHMPDDPNYGATWLAIHPSLGVFWQHYKQGLPSYASDPWYAYGGLLSSTSPIYDGDYTVGGQFNILRIKMINQSAPGTNDLNISHTSAVTTFNSGGGRIVFDGSPIYLGQISSDPTGVNGGIYYNTTTNKLRAYENGAWKDVISTGGGGGASDWATVLDLGGSFSANKDYRVAGNKFSLVGLNGVGFSLNGNVPQMNFVDTVNSLTASIKNASGLLQFDVGTGMAIKFNKSIRTMEASSPDDNNDFNVGSIRAITTNPNSLPEPYLVWNNSGTGDQFTVYKNPIGYSISVKNNGNVLIGNSNTDNGGGFKLQVNGTASFSSTIKISGGSPGAGKVLTSDADGDATWESITTPTTGDHTATLTSVTNVSSSTAIEGHYDRIGDYVTYYFSIEVTTTASGATEIGVSLPVASDFSSATKLHGSFSTDGSLSARASADATNDRIALKFNAPSASSFTFSGSVRYKVVAP